MNYELIYDAGTMSRTPWRALIFALGLTGLALVVWLWQRAQGEAAGGLFKWILCVAAVMWLVAAAAEYEKRSIAAKQPLHVEGPIESVWTQYVLRNAKKNEYTEWQGFRIGDVEFSYVRNSDTNYFHNAGDHGIDLVDGLRLRVHYLESRKEGRVKRYIVRVERIGSSPRQAES
jgi:hypothetical protein